MADLQPTPSTGMAETVREQDKVMLILSYFGILALIPLLTVKDSNYVKWHAKQGITLLVGVIAIDVAAGILISILTLITRGFGAVLGCFMPLIGLGFMVLSIFCMVKAVGGEKFRIPFIADLSEKW